ncbi:AMP-binding protein [Marinobacterium arenosum]|uniref:AMP-binding protein n=1 Tax=Marinobacterium arenosum TaxID=2862496 RepID=UPI001C938A78|nr:AMP-binding protein [Marinobacterium arenosum]MBY4676112.1 AMP-binding protein [Marinobacterium arenosum]
MAELTPLSGGLGASPGKLIAVDRGKTVTIADLRQRVLCWLEIMRDRQGTRWAVYHSDAFEFLAILLALWQLKRTACVPGDNCRGTTDRLKKHVDGFIGEFPTTALQANEKSVQVSSSGQWVTPDTNYAALEIYTSGSTGEPKPIQKSIAQLEHEVRALEALWPSQAGTVVLATVTHQHLYGMTFRLFWPFSSGQLFERALCEYAEDILQQAKLYLSFSLVSSPSHLGRLNEALSWEPLSGRCSYLISSAAPLKRADSQKACSLFAAPVREIYGSSETGAIAWRSQQESDQDALWQALPSVFLKPNEDGTLCVRSPYMGELERFSLPDRVAFDENGRFKLLGRVDRIAKVEGKRVSLAALEQRISENDLVENVRALTLQRQRVETGVVIQLTAEGWLELKRSGRKILVKRLKENLAAHFEAVVLPRRWRFVEQFPYNQQGKLPLGDLQKMFEKEAVSWPEVIDERVVDDQVKVRCVVPGNLIYFDGHFEGNPILPGIVQVHWAEYFGRHLLPVKGTFVRLEVIKFQQVVPPNTTMEITLQYDESRQKLIFKYESEKGVHSSGRICFG